MRLALDDSRTDDNATVKGPGNGGKTARDHYFARTERVMDALLQLHTPSAVLDRFDLCVTMYIQCCVVVVLYVLVLVLVLSSDQNLCRSVNSDFEDFLVPNTPRITRSPTVCMELFDRRYQIGERTVVWRELGLYSAEVLGGQLSRRGGPNRASEPALSRRGRRL